MNRENGKKRIDIGRAYLDGKWPLQPELTALPTDAELEAAEAEYDRIVSERTKAKANQGNRPRHDRQYWAWGLSIAAVFTLAFLLLPENEDTTTTATEVLPTVAEVDKGRRPTPDPSRQGGEKVKSEESRFARSEESKEASSLDSKSHSSLFTLHSSLPSPMGGGVGESSVDEITTQPEAEDLLASTAEADEEMQTRIEAIDAIAQAQAEQAFEAAVAAVLCSREPS